MRSEPLFCHPALEDAAYLAHLRATYEESLPDVAVVGELTPDLTIRFSDRAVATRAGILTRVYAGDYHTDSFDFQRLARRVRDAREFIWFWGQRAAIDDWLSGRCDAESCELGTVSVVDSSGEFGAGFGEICRSGSMSPVALKPFAVKRVMDFVTGALPVFHDSFHTLMLVPRTRSPGQGIRGGKSVNTIHRKYIRSRFFGFAPWYVMQGGFLECLEYREVNRSIDDVVRGMAVSAVLHFAQEEDARFARSLFAMNFPTHVDRLRFTRSENSGRAARYVMSSEANESIREFNHRSFDWVRHAEARDGAVSLPHLEAGAHKVSCTVVHLDLGDPDSVDAQQELHAQGYRLTCVRPPRAFSSSIQGGTFVGVSAQGSWAKPNPRWRIVEPHYTLRSAVDSEESNVLRHLTGLLRDWGGVA